MLRTILGSAIGGLTAGAVALGVAAYARPAAAPFMGVDPNHPYATTVAYPGAPGQGAPMLAQPGYYPQASYAPQPAYYAPLPAYAPAEIVTMPAPRPRAVARPAARPVATRERVVSREEDRRDDRSWGKTAMIIGGGAGGGAGIGGLIGGKKGALIGAAIGGGAATIYESTKR
ncbi:MAG: hypothetical protein Q8T13_18450 [Acidobacteriota bacterium]|nr:hypothetical protein [Acidobacteriota bacterium]